MLMNINNDMGTELWRPHWAGLVALLRSVGHVLDKVDGATDPRLRHAIDAAWKELSDSKPEPKIFWEFIEAERNNVLKTYTFSVGVGVTVRPGTVYLELATGETRSSPSVAAK
jgi:hypothetical protein